jgi:hypothetical protein
MPNLITLIIIKNLVKEFLIYEFYSNLIKNIFFLIYS